jgi:hypothetical protein
MFARTFLDTVTRPQVAKPLVARPNHTYHRSMLRFGMLVLVLAACHAESRPAGDAPPGVPAVTADAPIEAFVPPPPTHDAGPPPTVSCEVNAPMQCDLPPSTCLDDYYLIYYTSGTCVDGSCTYVTNYMYCSSRCEQGGCSGGFT